MYLVLMPVTRCWSTPSKNVGVGERNLLLINGVSWKVFFVCVCTRHVAKILSRCSTRNVMIIKSPYHPKSTIWPKDGCVQKRRCNSRCQFCSLSFDERCFLSSKSNRKCYHAPIMSQKANLCIVVINVSLQALQQVHCR